MGKKAVIFGWFRFPRGGATSNYIQYLAMALMALDYEVYVIGGSDDSSYRCPAKYKEINVDHIGVYTKKIKKYLDFNFFLGTLYLEKIKEYGLSENDLIISYSTNCFDINPVINYASKKNIKTAACLTEYFSHKQFKYGRKNPLYWRYLYTYHKIVPKMDYVFPISTYIQNLYTDKKCRTLCLPIMADAYEYTYTKKLDKEKTKFIYPANGLIKDSLDAMLKAIVNLPVETREKIELHLTNVRNKKELNILERDYSRLIGKTVILHDWMEYNDLINLYTDMDFLLLAREECQMTLANFPSKVPEVMCYGVIPIVSRVGDYTKYYLEDGRDSIIFDGFSAEDCVEAIKKAINLSKEEIRSMSENASKCIVEKFDYRVWVPRIKNFLNANEML